MQINTLVNSISLSDLPTKHDSIFQDYPGLGLTMKTFIKLKTYGKELKKYEQIVKTTQKENSITSVSISGSAFYYDQNELIKVEEFMIKDDKENKFEWYFSEDKCFYYTLKSDKADKRIPLLLNLSKGFQKTISDQN